MRRFVYALAASGALMIGASTSAMACYQSGCGGNYQGGYSTGIRRAYQGGYSSGYQGGYSNGGYQRSGTAAGYQDGRRLQLGLRRRLSATVAAAPTSG